MVYPCLHSRCSLLKSLNTADALNSQGDSSAAIAALGGVRISAILGLLELEYGSCAGFGIALQQLQQSMLSELLQSF